MKHLLIFILLLIVTANNIALCQHKLSGYVKDVRGVPIKYANVQIKDSYDGASTDSLGYFTFTTHETGRRIICFTHLTYTSTESEILVDSCSEHLINIVLKDRIRPLEEVVITSSIGYSKNKDVAINKMDVYTNPSANGDLALALRSTPGLQNIDNKEGFFVRGGNSDETAVTINGVIVNNFFTPGINNIAGRSRFETGLFKGMNFSTGDIPVTYGNAMSGSLELKIDDIPESNLYGFGLSPIYVTGNAGKVFSSETSYIEGAVTFSNPKLYYPMFMKKGWKFQGNNNGVTGTLRFQKKFANNSNLTFLSSIGNDHKGMSNLFDSVTIDNNIKNLIWINILDYQYFIGSNTTLNVSTGYSNEKNYNKTAIKDYATILNDTTKNELFQLHTKFSTNLSRFRLLYGIDYFNQRQTYDLKYFNEQTVAGYISSSFKINCIPLLFNLGIRGEYSSHYRQWSFLPRGLISYNINKYNSLTLGIGFYNQTENTFLNYGFIPSNKSESLQYNLTYQFKATNAKILRIQAFVKKYHNLTMLTKEDNTNFEVINDGHGFANGFDLFWKDAQSLPNFEYSLSYSYLDSKRDYFLGGHYGLPVFAAQHNASCILKYYIPGISSQFAVSFTYRSQMPYLIEEMNTVKYVPEMYSTNISYNYLFNIKKIRGVLSLSVPSVFNNNTVIGYQLNSQGKLEDITFPNKQTVFVSLFLNLGVDRRSEIINSLINY